MFTKSDCTRYFQVLYRGISEGIEEFSVVGSVQFLNYGKLFNIFPVCSGEPNMELLVSPLNKGDSVIIEPVPPFFRQFTGVKDIAVPEIPNAVGIRRIIIYDIRPSSAHKCTVRNADCENIKGISVMGLAAKSRAVNPPHPELLRVRIGSRGELVVGSAQNGKICIGRVFRISARCRGTACK